VLILTSTLAEEVVNKLAERFIKREAGWMSVMARVFLHPMLALLGSLSFNSMASAELGRASWYELTTPTASGETCNPNALTAAHPTLPFGTIVEVENLRNGRAVVVRINDRGPFVQNRVIDLTRAAAARLGFLSDGLAKSLARLRGVTVAGRKSSVSSGAFRQGSGKPPREATI
jgi:rare lipoprotein A